MVEDRGDVGGAHALWARLRAPLVPWNPPQAPVPERETLLLSLAGAQGPVASGSRHFESLIL